MKSQPVDSHEVTIDANEAFAAVQTAHRVQVEREMRQSAWQGLPPRPGSWIPRDTRPKVDQE
jgi:hypothetical protein